jgi:flagellar protein FliS
MGNVASPEQAYRRNAVLSATPAQLVVMLYDGAGRFLLQGATAMSRREIERAHISLRAGEQIIRHLDETIDDSQGDLAGHLHSIYRFCLGHLRTARMSLQPAGIEEVRNLLAELREAWAQVAEEASRG